VSRRTKLLQIRVTEREHRLIGEWAENEGLTMSNVVRRELGMDVSTGWERRAESVPAPQEAVAEVEEPGEEVEIVVWPEIDLAERREIRAKQLAAKMPLVKARAQALREIPE